MVLFWIAIAAVVVAAQVTLQPFAAAVVTIAAIVLGAYCYSRFCTRNTGINHALGSPDRPLLRNVFFFVWIFSPALFARR